MPLTLASMFTDRMVLQQGKKVPVWGTGDEGSRVTVEFQGQSKMATVEGGEWQLYLDPLRAGGPFEFTATVSDGSRISLEDVLVGEVWLAGGQSNMEQPLLFIEGGEEEIPNARYPEIRLFTTPRRPYPDARIPGWHFEPTFSDDARWEICTPEQARHFSAIGFHFAKSLHRDLDVPIGIVNCNWGGTSAQVWMSEERLRGDPETRWIWEEYEETAGKSDPGAHEAAFARYLADLERYIAVAGNIDERFRQFGLAGYHEMQKTAWALPIPPLGPRAFYRPCGLFHKMLKTVIPYACQGVLWYQGESNVTPREAFLYRKLLAALMDEWRTEWRDPELIFLVVQLAAYVPGDGAEGRSWAVLRESQAAAVRATRRAALVTAVDLGEPDNIHPVRKQPLADRLAAAALSLAYGKQAVYAAPEYRSCEVTGSKAFIRFDSPTGSALQAKGAAAGFEICGADGDFAKAHAVVSGPLEVTVWHPGIPEPEAVRYAWSNFPECGLRSEEDLPVAPFRTDAYPVL